MRCSLREHRALGADDVVQVALATKKPIRDGRYDQRQVARLRQIRAYSDLPVPGSEWRTAPRSIADHGRRPARYSAISWAKFNPHVRARPYSTAVSRRGRRSVSAPFPLRTIEAAFNRVTIPLAELPFRNAAVRSSISSPLTTSSATRTLGSRPTNRRMASATTFPLGTSRRITRSAPIVRGWVGYGGRGRCRPRSTRLTNLSRPRPILPSIDAAASGLSRCAL